MASPVRSFLFFVSWLLSCVLVPCRYMTAQRNRGNWKCLVQPQDISMLNAKSQQAGTFQHNMVWIFSLKYK